MVRNRSLFLLAILLLSSLVPGLAQGSVSRLGGDLRTASPTVLAASKPPAMAARLLGAPDASLRLERMILLLEPSAVQQQALTAELVALQNPASAEYHRWLSPAAFADAYANSAADVAAIASWLTGQGFTVAPLPASRGWIEFSGTAQQVEQAFGATLALASTPSGNRVVLTSAISVPSPLAPLVRGLVSLDGALSVPAMVTPQALALSAAELAGQTALAQASTLTPRLMASQLGLDALQATGSKGAGQTIGLAARAFPAKDDLAAFRSAFGLPELSVSYSGEAIDAPAAADRAAATLMASWAGVAAPQSRLSVAAAASTAATDGLDLALAALVDQAQLQTLAVGSSSCEAALSAAHQAFYAALYRQAAAEGITVISATGDSGAAACSKAGSDEPVSTGLAVNALASTPWNIAVGASGLTAEGAPAAWAPVNPADPAYASGGGLSTLYPLPAWQSTATASGFRALPDLALPTALDSASSPGVVLCLNSVSDSACTPYRTGGSAVASALMAGLSALATEKSGSLGNLASALYNTSTGAAGYQDIQQGTAQLACTASSSGCDSTGHIGYAAAQGFDQATGLGTAAATALVAQLARPLPNATTVPASVAIITGAQTVNPTASLTLVAQVTGSAGTATGSVKFLNVTTATVLASNVALSSSLASVTVNGGFAIGNNIIQAIYSGDPNYDAGTSATVTITGKAGTTNLALVSTPSSPYAGVASSATGTVTVTDYQGSAAPAGAVSLSVDGVAVSPQSINSSGVATFSLAAMAAGQHTLQGTYLTSNTNYSNSPQTTATVTVQKNAGPTLSLPASLSGASGTALTIPVTLSSSSAAAAAGVYPSGTLTFKLDGNQLATQAFTATAATTTISSSITLPATIGNRYLAVSYDGDNYYSTATTSGTLVITKATPTVSVAWPSTLVAGNPVTVSATVTGANATAPTGNLTFLVDGVSQTVQSLNAASSTTATATLAISGLSAATHTLAASYAGDTNYTSATSGTVSATFTKAASVTTLTASPATLTRNTTETFTAVVAPASPVAGVTYTLTGTVAFYDGTTLLKTVAVSGNKAVLAGVSLAGGVAHSITAVYSGDDTWLTSTSSEVVLGPLASAVNVVLTSNLTLVPVGRALVLTATVTPAIGTTAPNSPTGSVVFYEGTNIIGQAALTPTANSNSSVATLTLQVGSGGNWSGGTHTIFAVYVGDTNYDTATSNLLTLTVQDFTLTLNPTNPATNIDIVKGGAGTASINIKGWGGFNGLVQLTCAPTISVYLTCSASPQQVNPTADVSFVVQTYTTGGLTTISSNHLPGWPRALGGTALAGLFFLLLPFGRRARTFVNLGARRFLILVLLLAGLATAGIGCNQVTAVTAQGTPLGAYTMKVTGVAYVDNTVVNRTVNFTVNVYQQ